MKYKEEIILKIPFKKAMKKTERGWEGTARFKMADSAVEVKDDGKLIGHVNGCLGGSTEVYLQEDMHETMYVTSVKSIWDAYCDAINRPELKSD